MRFLNFFFFCFFAVPKLSRQPTASYLHRVQPSAGARVDANQVRDTWSWRRRGSRGKLPRTIPDDDDDGRPTPNNRRTCCYRLEAAVPTVYMRTIHYTYYYYYYYIVAVAPQSPILPEQWTWTRTRCVLNNNNKNDDDGGGSEEKDERRTTKTRRRYGSRREKPRHLVSDFFVLLPCLFMRR